MAKKIRVLVIYGGRSGEHEISLQSAASVIRNLDQSKFEIIPVGIDKNGRWHLHSLALLQKNSSAALPIFANEPEVVLPPTPANNALANLSLGSDKSKGSEVDVVFPVMHGPLCEDGTIQGLLELAGLPYVGSGVLGSAIGMDKDVAKRLAAASGIAVVPYVCVKKADWTKNQTALTQEISRLGFPVFVKPANMGSSVGVHKVKSANDLAAALADAFRFDLKVLVEKGINAREIELAVLENLEAGAEPIVSVAGEITPQGNHEFYSYEAKYLDADGAALQIPAKLSELELKQAQSMAKAAFECFELNGLARVDFFLDKDSGQLYLNEVNTMPGFTSISMYPKMMEASGISYQKLLTHLIELAMARHKAKSELETDYSKP